MLDVMVKHGDIEYDEDDFESSHYVDKSSQLEIRGKIKGASASSPKVIIKGHHIDIELN